MSAGRWDSEVDVLVVGSGAAGLAAAVVARDGGAQVLLIEKSELFGGTSATSGGGVWIPCSPLAEQAGQPDDFEAARSYLRAISDPNVDDSRIDAYVRSAPAMLAWMAERAGLEFTSVPYPDYYPDEPGWKAGWRTHFPVEFDGRTLGPLVNQMRQASPVASFLGRINWTLTETHMLLHRPPGWIGVFCRMLWRYFGDIGQRLRSPRDRFLTLGTAIVGRLLLAAQLLGVELRLRTRLEDIIVEEGRVAGAVIESEGKRLRVRARRGVVIAAGGFERNAALRARYLPPQASDPGMSGSQINNVGDGLVLAQRIGAAVLNLDSAWWAPVFKVPGEERARLCAFERAFPGCIMVNQAGQRYMNEAASYHIAAQRMMEADRPDARTVPSWILFDSRFRRHYPMGPLLPLVPLWLHPKAVRSIVVKARNWRELAARTGLPADELELTVARFNDAASRAEDPDFGRGATEYDRYYGDPAVQPNPTLLPLAEPPFYAMPLHLGDIGTNGGLATDACARVLDGNGKPIPGLYAAGNVTASVMGHAYPGAGGTLGPALTFGYLAGMELALG